MDKGERKQDSGILYLILGRPWLAAKWDLEDGHQASKALCPLWKEVAFWAGY